MPQALTGRTPLLRFFQARGQGFSARAPVRTPGRRQRRIGPLEAQESRTPSAFFEESGMTVRIGEAFQAGLGRRGIFWTVVGIAWVWTPLARGEPPQILFDLPAVVAARDVNASSPSAAGQKLVEIKLELSSLHRGGKDEDLEHYFIRVAGWQTPLSIVDYLPKTQHEALTSPVSVQDSTEQSYSLGITLAGKYELVSVTGPTIGVGGKRSSCVKYDRLPPLETVAASGTLARGSELFVKLRATPRHKLEGSRQLALVVQVPSDWRGQVLRVDCEAVGLRRGIVSTLDQTVVCGKKTLLVAVYLEGDSLGQQQAVQFAARQAARDGGSEPPAARNSLPRWTLRLPLAEPATR